MMHKKKENLGILGRVNIWHLKSLNEFVPPRHSKLISDIASIDQLFIVAHEIFQNNPEFRFKKHVTDTVTQVITGRLKLDFSLIVFSLSFIWYSFNLLDTDHGEYMKSLRLQQGIDIQNEPILSSNDENHTNDIFNIFLNDITDDGGVISAYKLMLSILGSDFRIAQQMDEHLSGCVPKGLINFHEHVHFCVYSKLSAILLQIYSNTFILMKVTFLDLTQYHADLFQWNLFMLFDNTSTTTFSTYPLLIIDLLSILTNLKLKVLMFFTLMLKQR